MVGHIVQNDLCRFRNSRIWVLNSIQEKFKFLNFFPFSFEIEEKLLKARHIVAARIFGDIGYRRASPISIFISLIPQNPDLRKNLPCGGRPVNEGITLITQKIA